MFIGSSPAFNTLIFVIKKKKKQKSILTDSYKLSAH